MTFKIERTSGLSFRPEKPCEKAYSKKVIWSTREERIQDVNGRFITQETPIYHEAWFIEINTLQDLLDLIKEVGDSIILTEDTIEIYDSLRE